MSHYNLERTNFDKQKQKDLEHASKGTESRKQKDRNIKQSKQRH